MENRYESKYGASRKISAGQYLAEFALERLAKREKTTLPTKYWENENWKKQFLQQVVQANKLLKQYTCLEIITALKSKRGLSIYSLGCKKPIEAIIEASKKIQGVSAKIISMDEGENIFDIDIADEGEVESKIVEKKNNLWSLLGD